MWSRDESTLSREAGDQGDSERCAAQRHGSGLAGKHLRRRGMWLHGNRTCDFEAWSLSDSDQHRARPSPGSRPRRTVRGADVTPVSTRHFSVECEDRGGVDGFDSDEDGRSPGLHACVQAPRDRAPAAARGSVQEGRAWVPSTRRGGYVTGRSLAACWRSRVALDYVSQGAKGATDG